MESEFDGIAKFKDLILNFGNNENSIATEEELDNILSEVKKEVRAAQKEAWNNYLNPLLELKDKAIELLNQLADFSPNKSFIQAEDRKSTRLNSSHVAISYAVFCL